MKKCLLLLAILILASCVEVGKFPEKRVKLHNMGNEDGYCEKNPSRCVEGVQW